MPANNPVTTLRTDKGQGIENHQNEINAWANLVNADLLDAGSVATWDYEGSVNPGGADTLTIGADVYEFQPTATSVTNDAYIGVFIGASAAATNINLSKAVNGTGTGIADGLENVAGGALLIEDGTERVLAVIDGTLINFSSAVSAGGAAVSADPSIVLAATFVGSNAWVQGNINVNTLGGAAAVVRTTGRSQMAVTAAMITDNLARFRFPFTPVGFHVDVRSAAGLPRYGSAAAGIVGCLDVFTIVGNAVECGLVGLAATNIAATDVITVTAWSA